MKGQYLIFILIICFTSLGNALECYVCDRQQGNKYKCLNTIITCEQGQDTCLTHMSWESYEYHFIGSQKELYVSKACSTEKECRRSKEGNMTNCNHVWYLDWKCTDCCMGDRCNYYIFSSANTYAISFNTLMATIFLPILGVYILQ